MKSLFLLLSLTLLTSTQATDLSLCKNLKAPMEYDIPQTYKYDQTDTSVFYKVLFDTGIELSKWDKDIEGIVRIALLENGMAYVHLLKRKYKTYVNKWGYEQKEIIRTKIIKRSQTSWTYNQKEQTINIEGIGHGHTAICNSQNPGLKFTYINGLKKLKIKKDSKRFLYLGGATYDILAL